MTVILSNNSSSRLGSSIDASATQITLVEGDGLLFPDISAGQTFPITVANQYGQFEIMRCIAKIGDELTVRRSQEGTPALSFSAGDIVQLRLTAGALAEYTNQRIHAACLYF